MIKKEQFFACKYTRTLYRTCAAYEMGLDAVALCCLVVNTEDATRYQKPVDFWNSQIQEYLGFKKWERLDRARKAAVEAGWLIYRQMSKRKAGVYETTVPEHAVCVFGQLEGEQSPLEGYNEGYKQGYNEGVKEGYEQGYKGGELPNLYLNPKPMPSPIERPAPLTEEEIRARCYVGKDELSTFKTLFAPFSTYQARRVIRILTKRRKNDGLHPRPSLSHLSPYILENQKKIKEWEPEDEQ